MGATHLGSARIIAIPGCDDQVAYCAGCHWFSEWHAITNADLPALQRAATQHTCRRPY